MRPLPIAILLALCVAAFHVPAASAATNPCPAESQYSWEGDSNYQPVTIPSLTHPNGIASFSGEIVSPQDLTAYPGPRPVVLLQHGLGGNLCGLWFLARDLAGHGYVSVVWTSPPNSNMALAFLNGTDAMRSAIVWVRSAANPLASISDGQRIALGGHSMGSIVTSLVQGDPDPGLKAAIALDNLRHWLSGDPGGAGPECAGDLGHEVTPRVPALGFAKDETCDSEPTVAPPDLKQPGFLHWRAHQVPSMELVMRGFAHSDFAGGGDEQQRLDLDWYVRAWLARWVLDDTSADATLLAETVNGRPTTDVLSTQFLSGAYLPGLIDTTDYRGWLESDRTPPDTRRKHGPAGRINRREVLRHGLRVRFAATEPDVTFRCRLDKAAWHRCKSPDVLHNAKPGRHTFRVRATDAAGNAEAESAKWSYRIVKPH